jgi:hypothetical protein
MAKYNYLDVSTGYVTPDDMQILKEEMQPIENERPIHRPVCAAAYDSGCFVFAFNAGDPDSQDKAYLKDLRDAGFSTFFCNLIKYAWTQDVFVIRLDADADDEIPELTEAPGWKPED